MSRRFRWFAARVMGNIRAKLLAGVLVLVPLVITYLVLQFVFVNLDGVLQPAVAALVGRPIPGAGLVVTLALLYMAGVVATNVFGARLVRGAEHVLDRMPVVRTLYTTSRKAMESMSRTDAPAFQRVVLVEYPRRGLYAVGFVTGQFLGPAGEALVTVFLPGTPVPTGGILTIVPADDVITTDLTVDEGVKLIVSGGILAPERIRALQGKGKEASRTNP